MGRSGGPCSPARHERAERRGVLRAGVVGVSSFQRWKALAAPAGAAAQAQTPVPQAAFVDLGVLASGAASRLELKLDLGGSLVLHLVRG